MPVSKVFIFNFRVNFYLLIIFNKVLLHNNYKIHTNAHVHSFMELLKNNKNIHTVIMNIGYNI